MYKYELTKKEEFELAPRAKRWVNREKGTKGNRRDHEAAERLIRSAAGRIMDVAKQCAGGRMDVAHELYAEGMLAASRCLFSFDPGTAKFSTMASTAAWRLMMRLKKTMGERWGREFPSGLGQNWDDGATPDALHMAVKDSDDWLITEREVDLEPDPDAPRRMAEQTLASVTDQRQVYILRSLYGLGVPQKSRAQLAAEFGFRSKSSVNNYAARATNEVRAKFGQQGELLGA
jgi:DNA-directed RNA polymerase specialized sigma24 family protein